MTTPVWIATRRDPQVLTGHDALRRMARSLDDLHAAAGTPVTARRTWLEAWSRSFPRFQPWVVIVPRPGGAGEGLDGAAPLATTRTAGLTTIVGMGHGHSDHMRLPARDPRAAAALGDALSAALQRRHGPWRLRVEQLPREDPVAERVVQRLRHATRFPLQGAGTPVQHLPPGTDASQFLSRSERKEHRRLRRRLDERGAVELAFTRDPGEIWALLPELASVRARRDHQQGRASVVDDRDGRAFWEAIIVDLAATRQVEVATLRCDGALLSYAVTLLDGDVCRLWDGRFDPAWSRYAPGALIDHAVTGHAIAQGFCQLDLMRGETSGKLRHASQVLPAVTLAAWSSAALRATEQGVTHAAHWARQRRDASPALHTLWRRFKKAALLRRVDRS